MRDYIIMTDSCCDLTDHMAKELELTVVPLTVHMNGKDYANMLDGSEISFEEFYKNIRSGILSTTSAANVGQFEDAMRAGVLDPDILPKDCTAVLGTTKSARITTMINSILRRRAMSTWWTPCPRRWGRGCCCIWRCRKSGRVCPLRSWCSG